MAKAADRLRVAPTRVDKIDKMVKLQPHPVSPCFYKVHLLFTFSKTCLLPLSPHVCICVTNFSSPEVS